jgi:LAO/AO transport system kinase
MNVRNGTPAIDVEVLAAGILSGNRSILARAITLIESSRPDHQKLGQELLVRLLPHAGGAHRIGISGLPGAGKLTFIDSFGTRLTSKGRRVAVLAVDPSSVRHGGSILGDKTRMNRLSNEPAAYIRPSPASGSLGGVTKSTREAILLLEAAGFNFVIVETVGVGQSETEVAEMVDTFLLLTVARPAMAYRESSEGSWSWLI